MTVAESYGEKVGLHCENEFERGGRIGMDSGIRGLVVRGGDGKLAR
jgi:hypothetical protein